MSGLPQPVQAEARRAALPMQRAVVFELASERFGIEARLCKQVSALSELTAIPRVPAFLLGVTHERGTVLPVVDIAPLLGLPARPRGASLSTLQIALGSVSLAIVVDQVHAVDFYPGASLRPLEEGARAELRRYGVGRLERAAGSVTMLDLPTMVVALKRNLVLDDSGLW